MARACGSRADSPEQQHLAGVGPDEAEQHLDDAGLAGAVGPEQAQHLAAADGEGDAVDRGLAPVPLAQSRAPHRRRRRQVGEQPFRGRGESTLRSPAPPQPAGHRQRLVGAQRAGHRGDDAVVDPDHARQRAVARREHRRRRPPTSAADAVISAAGTGSGSVVPSPEKPRSCAARSAGRPGRESR